MQLQRNMLLQFIHSNGKTQLTGFAQIHQQIRYSLIGGIMDIGCRAWAREQQFSTEEMPYLTGTISWGATLLQEGVMEKLLTSFMRIKLLIFLLILPT